MRLAREVRDLRKRARLSQEELAARAGVGLRFLRELERGKQTVRLDKVNQVLRLLSHEVGAVKHERTDG
jgi:y4mF family transcriptional regulator